MKKIDFVFVDSIPRDIEEGILYISMKYKTAIHKCPCGCGNEVVTPFSPARWQLTFDGDTITLYPSIGNWSFDCQSHYWIRNNNLIWASSFTEYEIKKNRENDINCLKKAIKKKKRFLFFL